MGEAVGTVEVGIKAIGEFAGAVQVAAEVTGQGADERAVQVPVAACYAW